MWVSHSLRKEMMYCLLEPIDFVFVDYVAFRGFSVFSTVKTTQLLDIGCYIWKITFWNLNQQNPKVSSTNTKATRLSTRIPLRQQCGTRVQASFPCPNSYAFSNSLVTLLHSLAYPTASIIRYRSNYRYNKSISSLSLVK
jgi:hypothetical protein